jgi:DNA-binding transcriptional regulator YiaG
MNSALKKVTEINKHMNALTMPEKIETNLELMPPPSTSCEKTAKKQKIDNSKKPPCSQMELRQSAVRVSQAEFARLMEVSKTSVTNWVKLGKITLHADGTIDAKQAAASIIEKSTPSKLRAKVFKQITNDAATLQNEIDRLNARVIELESALSDITTDRDEWHSGYWEQNAVLYEFAQRLTTNDALNKAVKKRDSNYIDQYLENMIFNNDEPISPAKEQHETENLQLDDDLPLDAEFCDADFLNEFNETTTNWKQNHESH